VIGSVVLCGAVGWVGLMKLGGKSVEHLPPNTRKEASAEMSELPRGYSSVLLKCIVPQPAARSSILDSNTKTVPATQYS